jgi:hypothetical protein
MRWGMNNTIESARVRGRWMLCEYPNFKGRCRTIKANVVTLVYLGLQNKVSSIRYLGR